MTPQTLSHFLRTIVSLHSTPFNFCLGICNSLSLTPNLFLDSVSSIFTQMWNEIVAPARIQDQDLATDHVLVDQRETSASSDHGSALQHETAASSFDDSNVVVPRISTRLARLVAWHHRRHTQKVLSYMGWNIEIRPFHDDYTDGLPTTTAARGAVEVVAESNNNLATMMVADFDHRVNGGTSQSSGQ